MQNKKNALLATVYLGIFMALFAVITTMFSTILPKITALYTLTLGQVSVFTVVQNYVANFVGTFFLVAWGDHFPKGVVIGIDALLMALLLLFIDTLPAYILLMIAFSALHLTTGILNNMITAFIADLYGAKRSRYISMMHIFYSVGALFGPKLPEAVEKLGLNWNASYAVLAIAGFVLVAGYFAIMLLTKHLNYKLPAHGGSSAKAPKQKLDLRAILRHPMFLPLCLLQMFYMSGHQNLFGNWFQLYLQRSYSDIYTESFTATCMTVYWFGMLGSRLLSMALADKVTPRRFITIGSAVGVAAQLLGLLGNTHTLWLITCLLLGLCTGGIYPLTFSISIAYFPQSSARITSLLSIISSIGGILLSLFMGKLAELSMFAAMFVPLVCLLIVFLLIRFRFSDEPKEA